MSQDTDKLLPHEYDGIQEYDNKLPKWWLLLFYLTIVIAIVYLAYFEVLKVGLNSQEAYNVEMKQAQTQIAKYKDSKHVTTLASKSEQTDVPVDKEAAAARGAKTFHSNCFTCHAADGGGGIGPNLTDKYWIHGDGSFTAIRDIVVKGVIEKGMPPKGGLSLSEAQVDDLIYFVKSLQNTTPKQPKAAEGNIVE